MSIVARVSNLKVLHLYLRRSCAERKRGAAEGMTTDYYGIDAVTMRVCGVLLLHLP